MANELVHIDSDLSWQTSENGHALFDADGIHLGMLPKSFTEDQIRAAARLANAWYAAGLQHGKKDAQADMRKALGITTH